MAKTIYMYILDTMADWETGYLLQGLAMQKMLSKAKYDFRTVAVSKEPVRTSGGMTLIPDCTLDEIHEAETAALLLPGADTWAENRQKAVLSLASTLLSNGILIAAICGATLGLANMGLLNERPHTSNALFFLTGMSKTYKGKSYYRNDMAVADGDLITAGSAGGLLWARYILERLNLYSSETIEAWYNYFKTGDARYFGQLMATFSKR